MSVRSTFPDSLALPPNPVALPSLGVAPSVGLTSGFSRAAQDPTSADGCKPLLAAAWTQGVIVRRSLPLLKLMLVVAGRAAVAVRLAMI